MEFGVKLANKNKCTPHLGANEIEASTVSPQVDERLLRAKET